MKDISTGEEICVSDTQNNTVTFAYYNDEIYFLEPNDDNHLYKYNVTLQEKSLVSDLVANKSSVRMSLFVCEQGIFYTKAIFYETGREQHLLYKLRDGEIIKIADDVDNIIGLIKNNIYVDSLSGIYEINLDNMEKNQLMKDSDFINTYMQSHYLICETLNLTDEEKDTVYIYDIDRKQLAATVRPSDL